MDDSDERKSLIAQMESVKEDLIALYKENPEMFVYAVYISTMNNDRIMLDFLKEAFPMEFELYQMSQRNFDAHSAAISIAESAINKARNSSKNLFK